MHFILRKTKQKMFLPANHHTVNVVQWIFELVHRIQPRKDFAEIAGLKYNEADSRSGRSTEFDETSKDETRRIVPQQKDNNDSIAHCTV